jgi:hypothetical protein
MKVAEYKKLVKPLEKDIQKEIINHLEKVGYYVQRLNSGSYPTATGFLRGVKSGTPDILAFKPCGSIHHVDKKEAVLLFVEVKRLGGKITPLQEDKMLELISFGARCIVAHSLEELIKEL